MLCIQIRTFAPGGRTTHHIFAMFIRGYPVTPPSNNSSTMPIPPWQLHVTSIPCLRSCLGGISKKSFTRFLTRPLSRRRMPTSVGSRHGTPEGTSFPNRKFFSKFFLIRTRNTPACSSIMHDNAPTCASNASKI